MCSLLFVSAAAFAESQSAVIPQVKATRHCYPMREFATPPYHNSSLLPEAQPATLPGPISLTCSIDKNVACTLPPLINIRPAFSFDKPLSPQAQQAHAKICVNNLMEGALYDFKKKNDLRFELGSPSCEFNTQKTSVIQYEEPFCLTFLLRFKL